MRGHEPATANSGSGRSRLNRRRLLCAVWLALAWPAVPAHAEDLVVSAAASLGNAFPEISKGFEASHPGTHVVFNFAASGPLLQQIAQGAPVDVFASADEETMDKAQKQNLIAAASRSDFAGNTLVLIVPAASKLVPKSLEDLVGPAWKLIAIGNVASVPAGNYAKQAIDLAGVGVRLEEKLVPGDSVRQVLSYVVRGEVEAGFVYASDAATEPGRVRVVLTLPTRTPIRYPIAQVASSRNAGLAQAFIASVQSAEGRAILQHHGFLAP